MSDIRGKRPKVLGARVAGLRLTQEERSVMARIDGELSVEQLVGVTGLAPERLEQIVSKLAFDGALDLGSDVRVPAAPSLGAHDSGTTSLGDFAAALGMDPSSFGDRAPAPPPRKVVKIVRRRPQEETPPPVVTPPVPEPEPVAAAEAGALAAPEPAVDDSERTAETQARDDDLPEMVDLPELEPAPPESSEIESREVATVDAPPADEPASAGESDTKETEEDEVARAVAERNYRALFEQRWHPMLADHRAGAAKAASGMDLLALCFDPDARVIIALLENATVGLDHVRLIALHHRTSTGLEMLARRHDWLRDILVERRLLRNPMIGEIVLGRVMGPKRLFPTYKVAIDRDIPDLTRVKCRGMIRQKWATAASEERADLLLRTEARCLTLMTGCTFDAKTTAILCGRPINSAMFVQSIAKFGAAPPALLAHLIKQPFVRKNPGLKKMLLQHPNMPGDVKRSI
jgi:hypothetical protein